MQKFYTLALSLFVAAFLFTGCDELSTVDFDFTIATDHTLNVQGTTQALSITETVDLTTNDKFNDNKDKIKNAAVDSVQYRIINFNGSPNALLNGRIEVAETITSPRELLYEIMNWNLSQEQTRTSNDTWVTIPLNAAGKEKLASLIKSDPHSATLSLTGATSEVPVNFTALFKIHWKMTAETDLI